MEFSHTQNTRLFLALQAVCAGVIVDELSVCRSIFDRGLEGSFFVFVFQNEEKKKHCISVESQFSFGVYFLSLFFFVFNYFSCLFFVRVERTTPDICVCM